MKIGIVGSRRRNEPEDLDILVEFLSKFDLDGDVQFVSGGCPKGADFFAEVIAKSTGIPITIHYPDKSQLPENPKRRDFAQINFERNTLIARDSDILVALVAPDRKGGTEDTIRKFKKMKNGPIFLL